jgi:hypothetical protein
MKFFNNFDGFLLEAFDLNKMYQKQKIVKEIQEEAKKIVDEYFSRQNPNDIPTDIQRNKEKVILWIAKQLKSYLIREIQISFDYIEKKLFGEEKDIRYNINVLHDNYIKGKIDSIPDEEIKELNQRLELDFIDFKHGKHQRQLTGIFDYFLSPMRNQQDAINLVTSTFEQMDEIQKAWHDNLKASSKILNEKGNVIKRYPDGFYWVDLLTNSSKEEGEAMGHCGRTNADTLLSLRRKSDGGFIEPFVTVAIDYAISTGNLKIKVHSKYSDIRQIKGKNNTKPVEKYHSYIVDLLLDKELDIRTLRNDEYLEGEDFHISDLKDKSKILDMLYKKPNLLKNIDDIAKLYSRGIIPDSYLSNVSTPETILFNSGNVYLRIKSISIWSLLFDEDEKQQDGEMTHRRRFEVIAEYLKRGITYGGKLFTYDSFYSFDMDMHQHQHLLTDKIRESIKNKYNKTIEELRDTDHATFVRIKKRLSVAFRYAQEDADREKAESVLMQKISEHTECELTKSSDSEYPYLFKLNEELMIELGNGFIASSIADWFAYNIIYVNHNPIQFELSELRGEVTADMLEKELNI